MIWTKNQKGHGPGLPCPPLDRPAAPCKQDRRQTMGWWIYSCVLRNLARLAPNTPFTKLRARAQKGLFLCFHGIVFQSFSTASIISAARVWKNREVTLLPIVESRKVVVWLWSIYKSNEKPHQSVDATGTAGICSLQICPETFVFSQQHPAIPTYMRAQHSCEHFFWNNNNWKIPNHNREITENVMWPACLTAKRNPIDNKPIAHTWEIFCWSHITFSWLFQPNNSRLTLVSVLFSCFCG